MVSINDFVGQLSIGSLVLCRFDSAEDRYLQVSGIYDLEEKKVFVGIPDDIKDAKIIECLPAKITDKLLLGFGFDIDVIESDDNSINNGYKISLKNGNTLILIKKIDNIRWNIYITNFRDKETPDAIIYLGNMLHFFQIQDIYRTFTSKNLQWRK